MESNVDILLLGNVDINLSKQPSAWNSITSVFGPEQLVEEATRVTKSSATLIDHIYVPFRLSHRLCPSTAGYRPPSMSSSVFFCRFLVPGGFCNEWHSFHARVGRFSPFLYLRSVAIAVILFWLRLVVLVSPCFLGSRIPRDYCFPRAPLFLCSERKSS